MAQLVKNPPAMRETSVRSLGWEDPLEKGKATHSDILAWRIPWTIQSMGLQRVGHDWASFTSSKLKTFVLQTLPRKWKENPQNGRKIPANYASDKGLVSSTQKEFLQLINIRMNNPIKNRQRIWIDFFSPVRYNGNSSVVQRLGLGAFIATARFNSWSWN